VLPDPPAELLARAVRSEASRPFVTYYDLASAGRVELSVATFDNWVSKTAGLLRDELDVEPGHTVSVVLPAHWLGMVWAMAVWTVGAHLVLESHDDAVVSVRAAGEESATSGQVVVVSTMPMGGPAGARVPVGALDYGREVLGYPDVFGPAEPSDDPWLEVLRNGLQERGQRERRLLVAERLDVDVLRDGLLGALLADGSTVVVRTDGYSADPDRIAAIARDENAAPAH
jgi:uncharacterized protein (TIGR03089 family)